MSAVLAFRTDLDREPVWENHAFQITPGGLVLKGETTSEADWRALGPRLVEIGSAADWSLGDWLLGLETRYGHIYDLAATITELKVQTLKNRQSVAAAFEGSVRRRTLTFSHHEAVAALDPATRDRLLDEAETARLSGEALRGRVREIRAMRRAQADARSNGQQMLLPGCASTPSREKPATREVPLHIPAAEFDAVMAAVNRLGVQFGTATITETVLVLVRQAETHRSIRSGGLPS